MIREALDEEDTDDRQDDHLGQEEEKSELCKRAKRKADSRTFVIVVAFEYPSVSGRGRNDEGERRRGTNDDGGDG